MPCFRRALFAPAVALPPSGRSETESAPPNMVLGWAGELNIIRGKHQPPTAAPPVLKTSASYFPNFSFLARPLPRPRRQSPDPGAHPQPPRQPSLRPHPRRDRSDVANRPAPHADPTARLICQVESQRDSVSKPRVARHELPWVAGGIGLQPQRGCGVGQSAAGRNPVGVGVH